MQPITFSLTGTGTSTAFLMDTFQNPFQVAVACILNQGPGTFSIQHTLDYNTVYAPTFNGATALVGGVVQTATWYNNSGITNATGSITGNYAFPVAAIRLNIINAVATTTITTVIAQASNAP